MNSLPITRREFLRDVTRLPFLAKAFDGRIPVTLAGEVVQLEAGLSYVSTATLDPAQFRNRIFDASGEVVRALLQGNSDRAQAALAKFRILTGRCRDPERGGSATPMYSGYEVQTIPATDVTRKMVLESEGGVTVVHCIAGTAENFSKVAGYYIQSIEHYIATGALAGNADLLPDVRSGSWADIGSVNRPASEAKGKSDTVSPVQLQKGEPPAFTDLSWKDWMERTPPELGTPGRGQT